MEGGKDKLSERVNVRVTKVEYLHDYKLKLTFSDRRVKVVDLEIKIKNAKGLFLPLQDVEYFKQVTLDDGPLSIHWPNGADICPEPAPRRMPRHRQSPRVYRQVQEEKAALKQPSSLDVHLVSELLINFITINFSQFLEFQKGFFLVLSDPPHRSQIRC